MEFSFHFSPSLRFAWGLIPNYPEKEEGGVEPADIIIR